MLRCFAIWVLFGRQKWQVLLFLVVENVELDERHCLVTLVSVGCIWIHMLIEVPSHVWLSFFVKFMSWAALSKKPAMVLMNDSRKFCLARFIEIMKLIYCDFFLILPMFFCGSSLIHEFVSSNALYNTIKPLKFLWDTQACLLRFFFFFC